MAVAAQAGYGVEMLDSDRDGVDMRISADEGLRPALELALEATTRLEPPKAGYAAYSLSLCHYERLRMRTQTPRILVVLDLPRQEERWSGVNFTELVLRHRAYWLNLQDPGFQGHDLRGHDLQYHDLRDHGLRDHGLQDRKEISNMNSVRIPIPTKNLFNAAALQWLMGLSMTGDI